MYDQPIPKTLKCESVIEATVVNCERCGGVGSYEVTTETDYHKRFFETARQTCDICEGDGRMIIIQEYFKVINLPERITRKIPYRENAYTQIDPFLKEVYRIAYKIDERDPTLERKYPDLKALSYDNYDKLVEEYRLIEILKK